MTSATMQANVYRLSGEGIEITYHRRENKLVTAGDADMWLADVPTEVVAHVDPAVGVIVTATLLASTRDGSRISLTLLLPEVSWPTDAHHTSTEATGVAVIERLHRGAVGGSPPALQSFGTVLALSGTASHG